MKKTESQKEYLIAINNRKSKRALAAALVVSVGTYIAVVYSIFENLSGESTFHYFTTLSNLLSAAGAMFMLPYAVEGIRKKRFTMPRWISLFQYAGAVSVFITMFCASTIISFTLGPAFAFGGTRFWLHLIMPVLAISLFLAVESGHTLTKKDTILAQIPFWIYSLLYMIMVLGVGTDRGGWADIYRTTGILPVWMVALLLFAIGYGAAVILRIIHNRIVDRGLRALIARWNDGTSPVELKIEAYGLGRYMAGHLDQTEIVIPVDLFLLMMKKSDVTLDELSKAFTKGVLNGLEESQGRH